MFFHVNTFYGYSLSEIEAFLLLFCNYLLAFYTLDINNIVDFNSWESIMSQIRKRTFRLLIGVIKEYDLSSIRDY